MYKIFQTQKYFDLTINRSLRSGFVRPTWPPTPAHELDKKPQKPTNTAVCKSMSARLHNRPSRTSIPLCDFWRQLWKRRCKSPPPSTPKTGAATRARPTFRRGKRTSEPTPDKQTHKFAYIVLVCRTRGILGNFHGSLPFMTFRLNVRRCRLRYVKGAVAQRK